MMLIWFNEDVERESSDRDFISVTALAFTVFSQVNIHYYNTTGQSTVSWLSTTRRKLLLWFQRIHNFGLSLRWTMIRAVTDHMWITYSDSTNQAVWEDIHNQIRVTFLWITWWHIIYSMAIRCLQFSDPSTTFSFILFSKFFRINISDTYICLW